MTPPAWMEQAACQGVDPVLFFGAEFETPADRQARVAQAKAICSSCPVRVDCRQWAFSFQAQVGIAGGLTEQERAQRRRRARRGAA